MRVKRVLDLYCGAGGAAMGYYRAFGPDTYILGVDIKPQPRYPFEFVQADALAFMRDGRGDGFDFYHASPPCQRFCDLKDMYNAKTHPDMLTPTREQLKALKGPYVIENVPGAPMQDYIVLCGTMFNLGWRDAELRRHRLFEIRPRVLIPLFVPACHHVRPRVIGVYGGHGRDGRRKHNTQDFSTDARRVAMGIDWMTGAELSQAIPPAYTEWIGRRIMEIAT